MNQQQYSYGMVGLGTMGCNLVLNMSDHGFSVAGYDKDAAKVEALNKYATEKKTFCLLRYYFFFTIPGNTPGNNVTGTCR